MPVAFTITQWRHTVKGIRQAGLLNWWRAPFYRPAARLLPSYSVSLIAGLRGHGKSAGFNMFVAKPFEPGELLTVIANLCETDAGKFGWSR